MPAGWSIDGSSRALCSSAFWMRRSTSRTASRYSSSFAPVAVPELAPAAAPTLSVTESRMLRSSATPRQPGRRVGAVAVAEQPLEDDARVVLHRQRRRRAAPGDRVGVGAAVAGSQAPDEVAPTRARARATRAACACPSSWRRSGPSRCRHWMSAPSVFFGVHAGQAASAGARMVARAVAEQRVGLLVRQAAQHEQPIAERRQRLQDRRELERRALGRRRPAAS